MLEYIIDWLFSEDSDWNDNTDDWWWNLYEQITGDVVSESLRGIVVVEDMIDIIYKMMGDMNRDQLVDIIGKDEIDRLMFIVNGDSSGLDVDKDYDGILKVGFRGCPAWNWFVDYNTDDGVYKLELLNDNDYMMLYGKLSDVNTNEVVYY